MALPRFRDISLKTKLLGFFLIVCFLPTLFIGLTSYNAAVSIIKDKEIEKNIRNLRDTDNIVSHYLSGKVALAAKFAADSHVLSYMRGGVSDPVADDSEIARLFVQFGGYDGVASIYLFDAAGDMKTDDPGRALSFDSIAASDWYHSGRLADGPVWGPPKQLDGVDILPLYLAAKDPATGRSTGIVLLNLDENYVFQIYSGFDVPDGEMLILDENGRILSGRNKYQLRQDLKDVFKVSDPLTQDQGYLEKRIIDDDFLLTYCKDSGYGWTYLSIERLSGLTAASDGIRRTTVLLCSAALLVMFLFSLFLSARITRPLKKLDTVMEEVGKGNRAVRAGFNSHDEIGRIGGAFDAMVTQVDQSIRDIYDAQNRLREAEIRMLRLQINPHFLYNTLSSIIWLANSDKKKEVIEMVSALSKFFRISLSDGRDTISLGEEIEQVRSYLSIQKIRYSREFEYEIDVDEELLAVRVQKLILQPLVENAIYHGVKTNETSGIVRIRGFEEAGSIVLEVLDNGAGLDAEGVARLNEALAAADEGAGAGAGVGPGSGIGTRNTNSRIRLFYGKEFGLSYRVEDGWTVARLILPKRLDAPGT